MRIAVFVLCLIGGIIGILGTIVGFGMLGVSAGLSESVGDTSTAEETAGLSGRVLVGFIAGITTLVGGSLVLARRAPRRWGVILIVINIVGSIAAGGFYMFGGALGLIAGIIALFIRPQKPAPMPQWAGPPAGWGQQLGWGQPQGWQGQAPPGGWTPPPGGWQPQPGPQPTPEGWTPPPGQSWPPYQGWGPPPDPGTPPVGGPGGQAPRT